MRGPNNVGRAVHIFALRFCDQGTKEMLGVMAQKFDRSQMLRNNSQLQATTCNRVSKRNPTMLHPFARGLSDRFHDDEAFLCNVYPNNWYPSGL